MFPSRATAREQGKISARPGVSAAKGRLRPPTPWRSLTTTGRTAQICEARGHRINWRHRGVSSMAWRARRILKTMRYP